MPGGKPIAMLCHSVEHLSPDLQSPHVNQYMYRSMIGSLIYLTAGRPDIMFVVCNCALYQANPKTSREAAVKRIFRYLKGRPKLGLWYPRGADLDLHVYSNSDYGGCNLDRKSTSGGCRYL
jgi:hypothetical protein